MLFSTWCEIGACSGDLILIEKPFTLWIVAAHSIYEEA